jgi:hypothetical protein
MAHDASLLGHHCYENGWTASVIAHGYNGPDTYEVWAWHEDGRTDEDVQGWLAASAVRVFLREVAARP